MRNLEKHNRVLLRRAFLTLALCSFAGSNANAEIKLGVNYESYFAKKEILYGEENYVNLTGRARWFSASENFSSGLDVGAIGAVNVSDYHGFYAPEAFIQFRQKDSDLIPQETTLGRKREAWSKIDTTWHLGLFEPMFRFDYLRPVDQGLTGAFLAWHGESVRFMLFVTDFFVPEQGPPSKVENKKIVSASPWFSEPASSAILLNGTATDIDYDLHIPPLKDIVLNFGIGSRLSVGDPDKGFWGSGSFLWAPQNRLPLPVTAPLNINVVDVSVYPQIQYHALGALDVGYAGDETSATLSGLYEYVDNLTLDPSLNRQRLDPSLFISPSIDQKLNVGWLPKCNVSVGYMKLIDGDYKEEGPIASDNGNLLGYRYDFTNALMVGTNMVFRDTEINRVEASFRWVEEFDQRGSLISLEFKYAPTKPLVFSLAGDFLGSHAPTDDKSGLINQYRGNDRFIGGMAYAF